MCTETLNKRLYFSLNSIFYQYHENMEQSGFVKIISLNRHQFLSFIDF